MANIDPWYGLVCAMEMRVSNARNECIRLEGELAEKRAELRGLQEGLECVKASKPKEALRSSGEV